MNEAWQILHLDRLVVTLKDIKAAYARLLKQHRPDQDPEGFQRLRRAYEWALKEIESGASRQPVDQTHAMEPGNPGALAQNAALPGTSDISAPDPKMRQVDEAIGQLRTSVASRNRQKMRESLLALDAAAESANLAASELSRLVFDVFGSHVTIFAEICSNDRIFAHALRGDFSLASTVVELLGHAGKIRRIVDLSDALRFRFKSFADARGAALAIQIALIIGRWHPQDASALTSLAYPCLAPEERQHLAGRVEQEIALGRIFDGLPIDHKTFWFRWVNGERVHCTWRDQDSRQLIHFVVSRYGANWPGFAVLQQVMPPDEWQAMANAVRFMYR